ncbi:hypothetical protein T4B_11497 [Trichinella pseudospiralis]|uniref:PiggyBac transposable element-derived protein domain-containing protein n=2 Tax=Trichinella pseudospiralis TaxID=6337 RepID=A0A0V1I7X2_TRIPS|nr:hypothetical protein T4B_11497 [Trichinella pseudospiralis]
MSKFQLLRFKKNGLTLMMGENDTLSITKKVTEVNFKVIAEDMSQKTNEVNLNFTCPVRMNLICHEDSASTDAVSTETDAESKESSFSNNFDDAASNYPDQEEHLIAASTSTSGESSEDELPDRKYMRVAVAESMEFTCKSGSAWTTTVPTTTQTLSHNLCLVLRTALELHWTVDEQLVSTHRQSKFRQYIRCKPGKYGIKIFCCCGAETSYPFAREIYVKRQPDLEAPRDEADLVKRLVKPGNSKGRNITTDNLFMSIPVTEDLLAKKTTTVGTLQKNKKEVPSELTELHSETKKCVLLFSTIHHDDAVRTDQEEKTDIVLFYSETKSWTIMYGFNAVDCVGIVAICYMDMQKSILGRLKDIP